MEKNIRRWRISVEREVINLKLSDVMRSLNLESPTGIGDDVEVKSGYVSDLLSDVMGNAPEGALWVTIQSHQNIVAVASLLGLSGIILAAGARPAEDTAAKAIEEKVTILTCSLSSWEAVGRLHALGICGARKGD